MGSTVNDLEYMGYTYVFDEAGYYVTTDKNDDSHPHTLCKCGSPDFWLIYTGPYELTAKCSRCGAEHIAYSG